MLIMELVWQQGDALGRSLLLVLLALSLACWTVLGLRLWHTRMLSQEIQSRLQARDPRVMGIPWQQRHVLLEQVLLRRLSLLRAEGERGLSVLGTIASVAPFVGLLGTVWGIFMALHRVGTTQQVGLAQIAGPVGEALIMTGIGLAVAIPALLGYNWCVRRQRVLMDQAQAAAHDVLIDLCVPGAESQAAALPEHSPVGASGAAVLPLTALARGGS